MPQARSGYRPTAGQASSHSPARILVVANRTATTSVLLSAVAERAASGDARFHLVVPATPQGLHRLVDPEVSGRGEAEGQVQAALPRLSAAAGEPVTGEVGDSDPINAIHDALFAKHFDEIIVSTLPRRVSRWLHIDLPSKARGSGLPVTHVEAGATVEVPEPAAAAAGS